MITRLDFAPLDGITRAVYRRVWAARFGGADSICIPFFSPTPQHILTDRDRRELVRENNPGGVTLVPQVMTNAAPELIWAAEVVRDLGYTEINLNLGCPSGTVTAKGKGSGFLRDPEALARFFDEAEGRVCLPLSAKIRIGFYSPEEFPRILDACNHASLSRLYIHPRIAKGKYRGPLYPEAFAYALRESRSPVSWNGDLRTIGEVRAFSEQFPTAEAVMIGRGAVADPALFRKLRGGPAASREELQAFTRCLYQAYQESYRGDRNLAARRMREVWFYLIHLFDDDGRRGKAMRRFRDASGYEAAEAAIYDSLPLRTDSAGELL